MLRYGTVRYPAGAGRAGVAVMVMQDGGAVDVRPGPDAGRAAPEHRGGYLAAGLSLALYGLTLTAWTLSDFVQGDGSVWDFVEELFNPRGAGQVPMLGPYEWALAVAFLAVAGLMLAQRRMARSAAMLLAFVLLAIALREGVGLFDADYRHQCGSDPLGGWLLATRGIGLLTALVVLGALLPAGGRRGRPADAPPPVCDYVDGGPGSDDGLGPVTDEGPGMWRRRPSRICGVLFLVLGLAQLAWLVQGLLPPTTEPGRYLRGTVDASAFGALHIAATIEFTTPGTVLALLVLGALAYRGRRDVRGALLLFAAVQLYLTVRDVVGLAVTDFFNRSLETTTGALSLATTAYGLAAMTSVVVLSTGRCGPYGGARGEALRAAATGRFGSR
ncbi:hypothetical protein [Streptomyces pinistramenti]|uniref:hypothetical protein n=1 Tax=Streptomyces pinistramenti TaxID=2884812 RepID=UPI001D07FBD6|nr:hypothetical protein [Streptomyces pinistramenti]MCB5911175.1 hypothetical protein [Streptomyces pinistramenti]